MSYLRTLAVVTALAPLAVAQTFSTSVITPGLVQAGTVSGTPSSIIPIGPLPSAGSISAFAGPVGGFATWSFTDPGRFTLNTTATGGGGGTSITDTGEWLVSLLGIGAPTYTALRIQNQVSAAPAPAVARILIDIDADGTIDITEATLSRTIGFVLGPTPKLFRIRVENRSVSGATTSALTQLQIVTPLQTSVQRVFATCSAPSLEVLTSPANDQLQLRLPRPVGLSLPQVLVFGASASSQLLGTDPTCSLLIPALDVVITPTITSGTIGIPIPAAVRPFTLWIQGVSVLPPLNLVTSDAWLVIGQP